MISKKITFFTKQRTTKKLSFFLNDLTFWNAVYQHCWIWIRNQFSSGSIFKSIFKSYIVILIPISIIVYWKRNLLYICLYEKKKKISIFTSSLSKLCIYPIHIIKPWQCKTLEKSRYFLVHLNYLCRRIRNFVLIPQSYSNMFNINTFKNMFNTFLYSYV